MKTLLALLLPALLWAADWPSLSGPTLDFHSDAKNIGRDWKTQPPALLWKAEMSDNGHACASCAEGRVFIVDHAGSNDIVRALSLADGQELWRYSYLDARKYYHGYARATPTCDGARIYTVSQSGIVHCLEAATGKPLWRKEYLTELAGQRPNHGFGAPIGIWGDLAYLQPGGSNGCVVAVNKRTGEQVWRSGSADKPGYSLPLIATFDQHPTLLCYSANTLMGLDPATGATRWTHPRVHTYGNNIIQPVVMGNRIYTGSTDFFGSVLIEVSGGKTREVWENKEICPVFTTPVLAKGVLIGTSSGKPANPEGLICFDPETGKVHWKVKAFENGQVLAADGVVLALDGQKGDLVMIEPAAEAYREITRFTPLGGRSWATLITVGNRLILRNQRELACFKLGEGDLKP
jgi:outer membrane protein assembly factor BamB